MKKIMNKIKSGYDNLMNGTKLGYYLRKTVSTKNAYLLFIIFGSLVLLGTYVSYALFTVAQEKDKAFKIIVGNLASNISSDELDDNNSIVLEANASRVATITILNTNSVKAKYNLNYVVYDNDNNITNDSVDVKYVEVSKDKPNRDGQYTIDKASSDSNSKVVKVILKNNTDAEKKVVFDSQVGLATTTLNNKENVKVVNQEFKYDFENYASGLDVENIPYVNTEEVEYMIMYRTGSGKSFNESARDNFFIKVSKKNVYMDVSETLDSQNVVVSYQSELGYDKNYPGLFEVWVMHPQTDNSLADAGSGNNVSSIYGKTGLLNISTYFDFEYQSMDTAITKKGTNPYTLLLGYDESGNAYKLVGTLKDNSTFVNGKKITIGFYGKYHKSSKAGSTDWFDRYFYDSSVFSPKLDENGDYIMPGFNLYTYDKTQFKDEIEKNKKKMYDYSPYLYGTEEYLNEINNAISNVYNVREVTQSQIDQIIKKLNKGPEHYKADYTALNEVLAQVEALDSTAYTTESWDNLQSAISKVEKDLYKEDQKKVNQFKTDIETAIQNLQAN